MGSDIGLNENDHFFHKWVRYSLSCRNLFKRGWDSYFRGCYEWQSILSIIFCTPITSFQWIPLVTLTNGGLKNELLEYETNINGFKDKERKTEA